MKGYEINLYPASINTVNGVKWVYINNKGEIILKVRYDSALDFQSNALAIIGIKDTYGIIDVKGKYIVEPKYGSINQFSEGRAVAIDEKGFSIIGEDGRVVTQKSYSFIGNYTEGRALFSSSNKKGKSLYGYLDINGTELIPAIYEMAGDFKKGKAVVKIKENEFALIGTNGERLNTYYFAYVGELGDGLLAFQKKASGKFGYIDEKGSIVISERYSMAGAFSNGRSIVNMSDSFINQIGLINRKGDFVIAPRHNDIKLLGENRVAVGKAIDNKRPYMGSKYSVADINGFFFIDFIYNDISEYVNGLASTYNNYYTFFIDIIGRGVKRLPIIDGSGTIEIRGTLVKAYVDQRISYFDQSGNLVWKQNSVIPLNKNYRVKEERFRPNMDYLVYYPQLQGITKEIAAKTVNNKLKLLSKIKEINENAQLDYNYTGNFSIEFFKKNLLVLQLNGYEYHFGAAHGMPSKVFPCINIVNGRFFELKDLFKENSNYIKILSDIVGKQIRTDSEYSYIFPNSYIGIKENQPFYVKEDALFLYFFPYEIAPYAAGFPTFKIPYSDILNIIDRKGEFWRSYNYITP